MKKRFTESQIVASIKKQEGGIAVKDICREIGISEATFYNWKAKYAVWKPVMYQDCGSWKRRMRS